MKKIMAILAALCIMVTFGWSQGDNAQNPDEPTVMKRAGLEELMENMPADIKAQVQNAFKKAEAAEKQIQEMKDEGKSDEEIEAALEQKRVQARERLQEAIDNLDKISEDAKGELKQVSEQIQKRLEERKAEFDEQKAQYEKALQEKKEDGTGTGEGGKK
jgi:DNA anti-recombination protein RmuC